MKRIAVLGSTGSIGTQTLDVIRRNPDRLKIVALAAGRNASELAFQASEFGPTAIALGDEAKRDELEEASHRCAPARFYGSTALEAIATRPDVDLVVVAVAGSVGTRATIAALQAGKDVALATKEALVAAGALVRKAREAGGGRLLPIDSEHSAIFQCLRGHPMREVAKLWLTASGGPFRDLNSGQLQSVTREDALNHPTWRMGPKITIDSATMMNKGLELIEAQWLFDLSIDRIDVVVHPQSLIHSFVEMIDGSLLAQLGVPDMRLPIAYALLYPDRADLGEGVPRLDPRAMKDLTFEAPDEERFPCLAIAKRAGRIGGTMPAVMNAANERAVSLFLEGRCAFTAIPATISAAMSRHEGSWVENPTLDQILDADRVVRSEIRA